MSELAEQVKRMEENHDYWRQLAEQRAKCLVAVKAERDAMANRVDTWHAIARDKGEQCKKLRESEAKYASLKQLHEASEELRKQWKGHYERANSQLAALEKAAEEMAAELEKKSAAVERMGRRIQRLEAEKRVKSSDATESSESLREVILDVVAESPGMNLSYVTQRVRAEQVLSGKVMPGTLRIHRAIHGMVAEGVLSKVIGGFYPTEHMWIKWKGGKCPVDREQKVKVLFRNNGRCTAPASHFRWMHEDREDDILGYMLVEIETAVL